MHIPCSVTKQFCTAHDNQTVVVHNVVEGESEKASENVSIYSRVTENLPKKPKGEVKFNDTLKVNENGYLSLYTEDSK